MPRLEIIFLVCIPVMCVSLGCDSQERVVRADGSTGDWVARGTTEKAQSDFFAPFRGKTSTEAEADQTAPTTTLDDGTVVLNCILPDNLISHLRNCLIEGNYQALYEQLVAQHTKDVYVQKGEDPTVMIEWFKENRRDLLVLLNRMSLGAMSPNTTFEQAGDIYSLALIPQLAKDQKFGRIDMIRQDRQFRLLMIE